MNEGSGAHGRDGQDDGVYWILVGGVEIPLRAPEVVIGRSEDCQIRIVEGPVSRRHARVVFDGGRYFLEDLGSGNGTLLNRVPVKGRVQIQIGDRIFIGTRELQIVGGPGGQGPTVPPPARTPAS